VEAKLFYEDRRADGQINMMKLTVTFRKSANAPENSVDLYFAVKIFNKKTTYPIIKHATIDSGQNFAKSSETPKKHQIVQYVTSKDPPPPKYYKFFHSLKRRNLQLKYSSVSDID
jgi:hypothetical protein